MITWLKIPENYDFETDEPGCGTVVLLGWHSSEGEWICEVAPYSTGRQKGEISLHGKATHFAYLPCPPFY